MLSHRIEREMEYSAKTTLPLNSIGIIYSLPVFRIVIHFGIIFTHIYLFAKGGESKRAYISLISIHFWRFMPKGEKVLAQSKRTAPPPNFKMKFSNWYLFVFSKGEKVSSKICKTLLNTKRRISLRGSFVQVKGKAFNTGGENFKILNASCNLIHIPLTICKRILKRILQKVCKNKTRGASVVQNFK
jgi:hypothetical protein